MFDVIFSIKSADYVISLLLVLMAFFWAIGMRIMMEGKTREIARRGGWWRFYSHTSLGLVMWLLIGSLTFCYYEHQQKVFTSTLALYGMLWALPIGLLVGQPLVMRRFKRNYYLLKS